VGLKLNLESLYSSEEGTDADVFLRQRHLKEISFGCDGNLESH